MRVFCLIVGLLCVTGTFAFGQGQPAANGNCPSPSELEAQHFVIRDANVETPFGFLRWLQPVTAEANARVASLRTQPFQKAAVSKAADAIDNSVFLPDAGGARVRFLYLRTSLQNCSAGQVDVVYEAVAAQAGAAILGLFESRQQERETPQKAGGAVKPARFSFAPTAGYNRSDRLFGGGRIESHFSPQSWLRSALVEGRASTSSHFVSAALMGSHDWQTSFFSHGEWQLNLQQQAAATDKQPLINGQLAGQFAFTSRPLGSVTWTLRLGGRTEGGNLQSGFAASELAVNTVASEGYGAAKMYAGVSARASH